MRIDHSHQDIPNLGRKVGRATSGSSAASRAKAEQVSEETARVEAPSSLMAGLSEIPEVRPEVIEEVRRRLARGEFMTRDAAEKTAESILADLASFIGA